jgi:hypothetical protein
VIIGALNEYVIGIQGGLRKGLRKYAFREKLEHMANPQLHELELELRKQVKGLRAAEPHTPDKKTCCGFPSTTSASIGAQLQTLAGQLKWSVGLYSLRCHKATEKCQQGYCRLAYYNACGFSASLIAHLFVAWHKDQKDIEGV